MPKGVISTRRGYVSGHVPELCTLPTRDAAEAPPAPSACRKHPAPWTVHAEKHGEARARGWERCAFAPGLCTR